MKLSSSAFQPRERIPAKYTGEGDDLSPPLSWSEVPEGTQEFALICDDPDAPRPTPWVHWLLYKIPPDRHGLDEGESDGGIEGKNDFGLAGYGGPMPPPGHGPHRYRFTLYALDAPVKVSPGATKDELRDGIKGHILDQAQLVGTYER